MKNIDGGDLIILAIVVGGIVMAGLTLYFDHLEKMARLVAK